MPCLVEGCGTISQLGGYCCVHGGRGPSCNVEGCNKFPRAGKNGREVHGERDVVAGEGEEVP